MTEIETINNGAILREIFQNITQYIGGIKRNLDVGHAKNLRFVSTLANIFPEIETVYYDNNQEFLERLKTRLKERRGEFPKNIKLSFNPEGTFDSATYFFTIHDFLDKEQTPLESQAAAYKLLNPGAKIFVIDYDLSWVRTEPSPLETFTRVFNQNNEKKTLIEEPDCYEKHTGYSLERCVQDLKTTGFKILESYSKPTKTPKLFLCVAEK